MSSFLRALLTAPRGDFLTLEPGKDALLVFAQEETAPALLDDDFSSYKGVSWMPIADFESDEAWYADRGSVSNVTGANIVEGSGAKQAVAPAGVNEYFEILLALSSDLSGGGKFTNSDFIVLYGKSTLIDMCTLYFFFGSPAAEETYAPAGETFFYRKKSDFSFSPQPSWGTCTYLDFMGMNSSASAGNVVWDYLRQEKVDPANANVPNATGAAWNFQPNAGKWTITEDMAGAGATLACLDNAAGVEKSALADLTTPDDVQFTARVCAKRDEGLVGLIFRSGQDTLTAGAEDCYAVLLDTSSNLLRIRRYVNGTPTEITTGGAGIAFTCAPDTWYAMGVTTSGTTIKVYAKEITNLSQDDDVLVDTNLLDTITSSTYTSGQCGLMSVSTLGRFGKVKMYDPASDKVKPGCALTLLGEAIFRTIAPFCE